MPFFFFFDKLQEIENLRKIIEQHGKLAPEVLRKVNYKFRLDWNYYSNIIEGNSLTMQETRSIMIGNITVDGKPIKDVMEMKGHDDVINHILKIGKSELNLSEKRIKNIHKSIMHEEDVAKQPFIGQWKTEPNYLYNYKKERFDFTVPADVKDEMHKLINWLNTEKEKIARNAEDALHPVQMAFHFHIDYVTIHPFYDGNGRTARIFTNLILISYGYPPVYVKNNEKEVYNQYLAEIQTYGGDTQLFYDFMAGLLIRSLQLVIDAIEGKVIEGADDWQKKLQLLKIETNEIDLGTTKNKKAIDDTLFNVIIPFLQALLSKLQAFDELFIEKEMLVSAPFNNANKIFLNASNLTDSIYFISDSLNDGIVFEYKLKTFKKDISNVFSISIKLHWRFRNVIFLYSNPHKKTSIQKSYYNNYDQEEIDVMINDIGEYIYQQIETNIKRND